MPHTGSSQKPSLAWVCEEGGFPTWGNLKTARTQWASRSFPALQSLIWVGPGVLLTLCCNEICCSGRVTRTQWHLVITSIEEFKIYFNTYLRIADIEYERHPFCSWKEVEGHLQDTLYFCTPAWHRSHLVLVKGCFSTMFNSWECCPAFFPIENI